MDAELINLGQRAVACKCWKWLPGMLIEDGYRIVWTDNETFLACDDRGTNLFGSTYSILVDLTDSATVGCLTALVRSCSGKTVNITPLTAYGHFNALKTHGPHRGQRVGLDGWGVYGLRVSDCLPVGDSEAEALVVALEMLSERA